MDQGASANIGFTVEMGEKSPVLRVHAGDRTIPIAVSPEAAADLALALLTAGAMCAAGNPRPRPGTPIVGGGSLPVVAWQTGHRLSSGRPLLNVRLPGGAALLLRFTPEDARGCAEALLSAGAAVGKPPASEGRG